jgi:hypothetical protein
VRRRAKSTADRRSSTWSLVEDRDSQSAFEHRKGGANFRGDLLKSMKSIVLPRMLFTRGRGCSLPRNESFCSAMAGIIRPLRVSAAGLQRGERTAVSGSNVRTAGCRTVSRTSRAIAPHAVAAYSLDDRTMVDASAPDSARLSGIKRRQKRARIAMVSAARKRGDRRSVRTRQPWRERPALVAAVIAKAAQTRGRSRHGCPLSGGCVAVSDSGRRKFAARARPPATLHRPST